MISMRAILKMSAYDCTAVPAARYRMIRASTQRLRFLAEVAYPYALKCASLGEIEAFETLERQARDNHTRSSAHVNKWNSTAVSANWDAFKQQSVGIVQMMADRLEQERNVLIPLLRSMGS